MEIWKWLKATGEQSLWHRRFSAMVSAIVRRSCMDHPPSYSPSISFLCPARCQAAPTVPWRTILECGDGRHGWAREACTHQLLPEVSDVQQNQLYLSYLEYPLCGLVCTRVVFIILNMGKIPDLFKHFTFCDISERARKRKLNFIHK